MIVELGAFALILALVLAGLTTALATACGTALVVSMWKNQAIG